MDWNSLYRSIDQMVCERVCGGVVWGCVRMRVAWVGVVWMREV